MTTDRPKCRNCKWLDVGNKHKSGFYECINPNIRHTTKTGHLKYTHSPACIKGFEGFDGRTLEHAPKATDVAYQKGQLDILKEIKRELIDSDFVTFSQVVDFLTNKIEEVKKNDAK